MVSLRRFYHQFLLEPVTYKEGALTAEEIWLLEVRGHKLDLNQRSFGNMNVVTWDYATGKVKAAMNPRGPRGEQGIAGKL
jgi:gamma-glutamyltranspeptidase/glutathione hydrolase